MTEKIVYCLATGGTIAGSGAAGQAACYRAGELAIQAVLDSVPGLEALAAVRGEQVANLDSVEADEALWRQLAQRINELAADPAVAGFVVTHGTDTLEETAYYLHLTVKTAKPVVVTGAMRPATALSADGPMNLYQAVALAACPEAAGRGVLVAFADGIYGAREVQKVSTTRPEAFAGRDLGCLGYLRDDQPSFYLRSERRHTVDTPFTARELPPVAIAYFAAGADPQVVRYLLAHNAGLVIAGAGAGGLSASWLAALVGESKPVVIVSRVANGLVTPGAQWPPCCVSGDTLNAQKARVLLQLALTQTSDPAMVAAMFRTY